MKQSKFAALVLVAALGTVPAIFAGQKPVETKETKTVPTTSVSPDQAAMQKEAKITMENARLIALKRAPGTITSAELEREHGKLIYSFDIKTSKSGVTEVNVNALDGKIVAVQHENAAKEAAEKKQEAKEKNAKQQ